MNNDTKKKGLIIRLTPAVSEYLDRKKRETGVPKATWITMLVVREMEKEDNKK